VDGLIRPIEPEASEHTGSDLGDRRAPSSFELRGEVEVARTLSKRCRARIDDLDLGTADFLNVAIATK
jgi:hypothetical protein